MKSLWIVNKCCGGLHRKLHGKKATGGQWLDAMLEEAAQFPDDYIVVVNVEVSPDLEFYQEGNVTYYTIKGQPNAKYDYKSQQSIAAWKAILQKEKPDVIEIWGTEFPYALAAMDAAPDVPAVIYVQGILDSIEKYYLSGLSNTELKKARTLRDVLTGTTIRQTQKGFGRRAEYEKEIIRRAGHVIIENQWAAAYLRKLCPDVQVHFLPISISDSFRNQHWSEKIMQQHTIMCPAADYPIKGLHMLMKALVIVNERYPNVKLYIPGAPLKETKTLKEKLKQSGYAHLISTMLRELGLKENMIYTGRLTADEMAQKMATVNCFVMTSAIENHSSTLKEAMTVGTPCIASYVGGVPEYAVNEENCLLYRYEDYEVLAQNICRLFEDGQLRTRLSAAAAAGMERKQAKTDYERMREVLNTAISGKE